MKVTVTFESIDWKLLAEQKKILLENLWRNEQLRQLWGIVHLLDEIQDQAEEAGHPVEFMMEPETC